MHRVKPKHIKTTQSNGEGKKTNQDATIRICRRSGGRVVSPYPHFQRQIGVVEGHAADVLPMGQHHDEKIFGAQGNHALELGVSLISPCHHFLKALGRRERAEGYEQVMQEITNIAGRLPSCLKSD